MRRTLVAIVLLPAAAAAQLADLQPGRNFVSEPSFGSDATESIRLGDCDGDGDLDVAAANGGEHGPQVTRLFINQGGLQGGVTGTFTDETAARMGGAPADASRDVNFVDIDNDDDLDIFVANVGTVFHTGAPSRFHVNLGGLQAGAPGYYSDQTDTRWGHLVTIPPEDQLFGGDQGPFREHCFDGEFGDLDDDGHLDLFFAETFGYGNDSDSKVFLNDGQGVFDELWPWTEAGSDTFMTTCDADLDDLDDDFDLDIFVPNRNTAPRAWVNRMNEPAAGVAFSDVTQAALLAGGLIYGWGLTVATEPADLDGDGDLELWMLNLSPPNSTTKDSILRHDGAVAGSSFGFTKVTTWIKGDPSGDDEDVDPIDYDADGDLDVLIAGFAGTDYLYQSALTQGLDPDTAGLFHRNGTTGGGSLAPHFELPQGGPSMIMTTLDADCGDVDNDGDEDAVMATRGNGTIDDLFRNALGVPDTHAPLVHRLEQVSDQPAGEDAVVHALVRDNSAGYLVATYAARMLVSIGGGPETTWPLRTQGGHLFRGVIPDLGDATVSYRVEVTDRAGNVGVSDTFTFVQGAGSGPWTDLEGGLAGAAGNPQLAGSGMLLAGSAGSLALSLAAPTAPTLLLASLAETPAPFKGGTLSALPAVLLVPLSSDGGGGWTLPWAAWPAGVPAGTTLHFQVLVDDGAALQGVAISNLLRGTTP